MTFTRPRTTDHRRQDPWPVVRRLSSVVCRLFPYLAPQFFQMADAKKQNPAAKSQNLFSKENYKWMLIGLVVILLGVILMIGGKSDDPNQFNVNEVYSFRRITLAPVVILAGFAIEIYAIFRKPHRK